MPTLYCTADGAGPRECPDWRALYAAEGADHDALDAQRIGEPGHVARNGNAPRTADGVVPETFEIVGPEDEHGGCLTAPAMRCPECGAPVRCVVS